MTHSIVITLILFLLVNPLLTYASTCKARQHKGSDGGDRPTIVPRYLIQDNGTEVYEELYRTSFNASKYHGEDIVLLDAKSRKVSIWKKGYVNDYSSEEKFSEFIQCLVNMVRVKLDKRNDKRLLEERVRKLDEEFIEDAFQNCGKDKLSDTWNNAVEKIKHIMEERDDTRDRSRDDGNNSNNSKEGPKYKDQSSTKFTSVIFFLTTMFIICTPHGFVINSFKEHLLNFDRKSKKRKLCMALSIFIIGVFTLLLIISVSKEVLLPMFPIQEG